MTSSVRQRLARLRRRARSMPRSSAEARERWEEERLARLLAHNTLRDLTPPRPRRFKSYGTNSWIVPPARITHPEMISIGSDVVVNEHAWLSVTPEVEGYEPDLRIGDRVLIDRLVHVACVGETYIEDDVFLAERVLVGDTFHEYEDVTTPIVRQPLAPPVRTVVGRGSFVGLAALILPGVKIGEQACVGAGAVVTHDVPDRTLVVGNPARAVRRYDEASGTWVRIDPT